MTTTTIIDGYAYREVGTDLYRAECHKCGGNGLYYAPTSITDSSGRPFCLRCMGTGVLGKALSYSNTLKRSHRLQQASAKREALREVEREARFQQYQAELALREASEAERMRTASVWSHLVAEQGYKVTFTGTVVLTKSVETMYGYSVLVIIEDAVAHRSVKAFTTAQWVYDVAVGDEVTVTGTVKSFEEYESKKNTMLTRVKRTN
jgi:hypothetical protein